MQYLPFIRSHQDNRDVVYDQPNNESFSVKLEKIQYNTALAITGIIKCTSREKLYKELGLEFLKCRGRLGRLHTFYKIKATGFPGYLNKFIPITSYQYQTGTAEDTPTYQCRIEAYTPFFTWLIIEWNKIDLSILTHLTQF